MIKSLDLGLGIFLVLNHGSLEKLFLVGEQKKRKYKFPLFYLKV